MFNYQGRIQDFINTIVYLLFSIQDVPAVSMFTEQICRAVSQIFAQEYFPECYTHILCLKVNKSKQNEITFYCFGWVFFYRIRE